MYGLVISHVSLGINGHCDASDYKVIKIKFSLRATYLLRSELNFNFKFVVSEKMIY